MFGINMEIKENLKLSKKLPRFFCEKCDFKCYMKCDWERHIVRPKHLMEANGNQIEPQKLKKTYNCGCGKKYDSKSGLWKHKQSCIYESKSDENMYNKSDDISQKELIMLLIKENTEMKQMMMEVIKNGTHNNNNNNNNNTNNSHNKTFNLQFFLNETCKDAINITDFVNSIDLQISDLEETGQIGYVEGISKVVIKNLNNLDTNKRPIHCSDLKREVLYIKDDNQWTKENENKDKMKNAIKQIAHKNIKQIPEWVKMHPTCLQADSKQNDKYLKMVSNCMSGGTSNEQNTNINKIISKVAKEVIIEKECI